MDNIVDTTVIAGPSAWTRAAAAADPAHPAFVMPVGTAPSLVNYIRSARAVDASLRPTDGAAKQAAPPRGVRC